MQIKNTCGRLLGLIAVSACGLVGANDIQVTGPIASGTDSVPFSTPTMDIAARGYVVEEFFLAGKASAYRTVGGAEQSSDGRWLTEREAEAMPYKTRILVVRPAANRDFKGTVIVHWQNVTAGYELGSVTDGEYLRGYAWVGVSAPVGGGEGISRTRCGRFETVECRAYGSLNHPGDAYSFDIFSQAGSVVAQELARNNDPMGGLDVRHLVAAGASQSASRLRTYINGVHLDARVFDGFIPYIDFASTINFAADKAGERRRGRRTTRVRDDLDVPVFVVNSETETQAYLGARQQNTDRFRFWEVAGTSHVSVPSRG